MTDKHSTKSTNIGGYDRGHPWYYLLGNPVAAMRQIRATARASDYRGYRQVEILAATNKPEPKRSQILREIRGGIEDELTRDISRYRQCALQLHALRREEGTPENPSCCNDIHTAISLKHNHIYNSFAHLALLDDLPVQQGDLFS